MRLFALSDIHSDFPENYKWIANLSHQDYTEDVLIMAGDIGHDLKVVKDTFRILTAKFKKVFFIPGNHDLWTVNYAGDSLDKEKELISMAIDAGVETRPRVIGDTYIVPLYAWYDFSFGELTPKLRDAWQDFVWCRWPDSMDMEAVTKHFLDRNKSQVRTPEASRVVTYSHYLPRIDVMPTYIPDHHRIVYPVLGTNKLDKQVRAFGADVHIYGHSHVNRETTIDGVTYINNALGYPQETRICRRELFDLSTLSGM
ncbi:metallophosphoesterase [Roseivirga sp. BDSF3-8]|uniref:metallophosphoesterase n=1 Tax=Roseivirga sp. BDSF3-8 TaxID=3241598 RepID=UPI003531EB03